MILKDEVRAIIAAEPGLHLFQVFDRLMRRRPLARLAVRLLGRDNCVTDALVPSSTELFSALSDLEAEAHVMRLMTGDPGGRVTATFFPLARSETP
jgi:hypothetical protein